ncbi:MAG: type IV pilin protein [Angustibacter sp.]
MRARLGIKADQQDGGFSLIELLVVMIVIGVLAAIAVPVFLNQRQKAVNASMKSDLRSVAQEMENYFVDNGREYPPGATGAGTVNVGAEPVRLSRGTTVTVITSTGAGVVAGTYCLRAENVKASDVWYYDSDQGGLRDNACA